MRFRVVYGMTVSHIDPDKQYNRLMAKLTSLMRATSCGSIN